METIKEDVTKFIYSINKVDFFLSVIVTLGLYFIIKRFSNPDEITTKNYVNPITTVMTNNNTDLIIWTADSQSSWSSRSPKIIQSITAPISYKIDGASSEIIFNDESRTLIITSYQVKNLNRNDVQLQIFKREQTDTNYTMILDLGTIPAGADMQTPIYFKQNEKIYDEIKPGTSFIAKLMLNGKDQYNNKSYVALQFQVLPYNVTAKKQL